MATAAGVGVGGEGSSRGTHAGCVMVLAQPFTPRGILEREDEVWFRDFGFGRVVRRLGACCSAQMYIQEWDMRNGVGGGGGDGGSLKVEHENGNQEKSREWVNDGTMCCCVVDSGFSVTHIVPTYKTYAIVSIRNCFLLQLQCPVTEDLKRFFVSFPSWVADGRKKPYDESI